MSGVTPPLPICLRGIYKDNFKVQLLFTILTYLLTPRSRVLLEKPPGFAANQEIPRILWNPKVHYRTHKRPPPVPILSKLHPLPTAPSHFLKIHLNIILPSTSWSPQWSLILAVEKKISTRKRGHLVYGNVDTRSAYRVFVCCNMRSLSVCKVENGSNSVQLCHPQMNLLLSVVPRSSESVTYVIQTTNPWVTNVWRRYSQLILLIKTFYFTTLDLSSVTGRNNLKRITV